MAKYEVWMTKRPEQIIPVIKEVRAHNKVDLRCAHYMVMHDRPPVKLYGHELKRACIGFIAKIPPRAGGEYEIRCKRKDVKGWAKHQITL